MGGYLNFKLEEAIVELNLALELLQISYLGKGLVTDSMVVKEMGESEGVEVFNINLDFIRQRRIKAHFLKDRKPENYKDISDKYRRKVEFFDIYSVLSVPNPWTYFINDKKEEVEVAKECNNELASIMEKFP